MSSAVFLDTSVVIAFLFDEKANHDEWMRIDALIRKSSYVIASRLLALELERTFLRVRKTGLLDESGLNEKRERTRLNFSRMAFIEITREIMDQASKIAPNSGLRSLDAIHLSTFLAVRQNDPHAKLLTLDRKLMAALTGC